MSSIISTMIECSRWDLCEHRVFHRFTVQRNFRHTHNICIYICIYICIHIYICIYVCIYMYIYIHMKVSWNGGTPKSSMLSSDVFTMIFHCKPSHQSGCPPKNGPQVYRFSDNVHTSQLTLEEKAQKCADEMGMTLGNYDWIWLLNS